MDIAARVFRYGADEAMFVIDIIGLELAEHL